MYQDSANLRNRASADDLLQKLSYKIKELEMQVRNPCTSTLDIRSISRCRSLRSKFFSSGLFADPAWDMLLELYANELEQHRISVSKLCLAAEVPPTTALRWIRTLEREGLIVRIDDTNDGRRVWVQLSSNGLAAMKQYFDAVTAQAIII